ncbi:Uncharacterised protein [Mycobacteroides abscessus]|nr:Uncharacterised protein [Mycobacteroides abscessus]
MVSVRSGLPQRKFSARAVNVNGNGRSCVVCAAAVMRSTASASGKIGASGRPVASSIDPPTSPEAAASRMVIAMSPMVGPPFSKSADTGRCVAAAI